MNLYDLLKRGDRMVDAGTPPARAGVRKEPGGTLRAVHIPDGGELRLREAHRATALREFPTCPGWSCLVPPGASLQVSLRAGTSRHVLARIDAPVPVAAAEGARRWWARRAGAAVAVAAEPAAAPACLREIGLAWPVPVPPDFDLLITAEGGAVDVVVGPLFDPRKRLLPLLRGRGVEVGPGANPAVRADGTRTVTYVEKLDRDAWSRTYPKAALDPAVGALWDAYVVDSARRLDRFADASLDFVFSSHVLEHLVDPISVLRAWWAKLVPGGVVAGVVPDARYTFDLRQPLTSLDTLLAQFEQRLEAPTEAMYERWCRDTSPGATAGSLRDRDYAIHVNFFSPPGLRDLLDAVAGESGGTAGVFIESVRNGKDFGFAMFKP
jgi:SAM-dependent methyltransferase